MKKVMLYLLIAIPALSFSQNFYWLKTVGDINHDFGEWVETDSAGNIYVAGMGQGTCNFDTHILASADPFWFVAKYDSNGINTWVAEIPFNNGYTFEMRDFKVNKEGETYIVGDVNTNGGLYGMLVKIDSAGNLVKQITPPTTQNIYSITFDSDENYYIGGGGYSGNNTVMFITKYSANDNFNWRVNFTNAMGLYNNLSMRVTEDDGLLFSFIFKNSLTVTDHSTGSITLNATQGILDVDRAIAKYDVNGVLVWAKNYDDAMPARQMTVDTVHNSFYLLTHEATAGGDDYLLMFNSVGNQMWSKDINHQNAILGWEPKIRLHENVLYFIGGGTSVAVGGGSWGDFACKWFDLNGNLQGQFNRDQGIYPILGDIAFYRNTAYLVGGIGAGTWGGQTITVHGTSYDDYFLAAMSQDNFTSTTGVAATSVQTAFVIYPNPTSDEIHIVFDNTDQRKEVTLQDITGNILSVWQITGEQTQFINLSSFSSGVYFVSCKTGEQCLIKKVLKL